jgi:hypothetical protein
MMKQPGSPWIVVAAVVIAFGVGSGWQFTKARQGRLERDAARQELAEVQRLRALDQLEASLAMATVATQLGDFERGRQLASGFFDMLQEQESTAPQSTRTALNEILTRRDGIITVLSREQPESELELAALLTSLQNALGREPTVRAHQQSGAPEAARE